MGSGTPRGFLEHRESTREFIISEVESSSALKVTILHSSVLYSINTFLEDSTRLLCFLLCTGLYSEQLLTRDILNRWQLTTAQENQTGRTSCLSDHLHQHQLRKCLLLSLILTHQ